MTPSQMQAVARVLGADSTRFMFRGDDGSLVRLPETVADDGSLFYALLLKLAEREMRIDFTQHDEGDCRIIVDGPGPVGYGPTPLDALAAAVESMEGGT